MSQAFSFKQGDESVTFQDGIQVNEAISIFNIGIRRKLGNQIECNCVMTRVKGPNGWQFEYLIFH